MPAGEMSYYRIVPAVPQISYPTVPSAAAKCVLVPAKSSSGKFYIITIIYFNRIIQITIFPQN